MKQREVHKRIIEITELRVTFLSCSARNLIAVLTKLDQGSKGTTVGGVIIAGDLVLLIVLAVILVITVLGVEENKL